MVSEGIFHGLHSMWGSLAWISKEPAAASSPLEKYRDLLLNLNVQLLREISNYDVGVTTDATVGITLGAEFASGVGESKFFFNAGVYALGLATCAAGQQ